MTTSDARIAANRLNAQKSTGPKSPPGMVSASRNSLKHGLSGRGIVLPEAEEAAIKERLAAWRAGYATVGASESFAFEEMVRESVRIERCNAEEIALRGRVVDRAKSCWADDRRVAAEELGAKLRGRPSLVARQLAMTPQGCDWLIERWEALALAAGSDDSWDERHAALANDLLGVPAEFRDGPCKLDPSDASAAPDIVRAHRLSAIAAELARLRERREGIVAGLDADDRSMTVDGVEVETDRNLARLRRYASASQRRFAAAAKLLKPAADRAESYASYANEARFVPEFSANVSFEPTGSPLFLREPTETLSRSILPPVDPPSAPPMNRQQRRALARRQPELVC